MPATEPQRPPIRVGLLGCGNVGLALYELLADPSQADALEARTGWRFEVVAIAVSSLRRRRSSASWFNPSVLTTNPLAVATRDDVDVVVELMGGIEGTAEVVAAALRAGKPVVTANKALLAARGQQLATLAARHGVALRAEASVAGAIPILRVLEDSLAGEHVERVMGIVNGTTNFILSKMDAEGRDYAEVLAEAQQLGLAERDPSADVDGHDAAAKAAILATLAFGTRVTSREVHVEGITAVRSADVAFARQLGFAVKLLAICERVGAEGISVRVHPAMVPLEHPLAAVDGAFNAVFVEGASCGELMLYGRGAGGRPTASAVLGDLLDVARNPSGRGEALPTAPLHRVKLGDLHAAFYLSIDVADEPGVLAAVATVFGRHGVSIRSMEQVGLGAEARLVFLTHTAEESAMAATLRDLRRLRSVDRVGALLRVIGPEAS